MYAVETNRVGMPSIGNVGRKPIYPFARLLKVGQSFFVPDATDDVKASVYASSAYWTRKLNRKFCCRSMDGGIRVWRLA